MSRVECFSRRIFLFGIFIAVCLHGSGAHALNVNSVDFEKDEAQYLLAPDSDSLDIVGDIAIEAWLKPESEPGFDKAFAIFSKQVDAYHFDYEDGAPGGLRLRLFLNNETINCPVNLGVGTWKHVAVSYRGSDKATAFYVDGVQQCSGVHTQSPSITERPANIGRRTERGDMPLDGHIDEVRIWNVARTEAEIVADMNRELVGDEVGLVGYWKLNGSFEDATVNGNHLTPVNGPQFSTDTPFTDAEETIDPVIVIPGILGSAQRHDVWIIDPILHTYDDLIATLDENGYTLGEDLFTFGYDWRNSNVATAELLKQRIDEVKGICACSKVDLVAHSMGGLVARQYVQSGDYENDVDQLVFLGTPHRGAPKAYLMWEGGEFVSPSLADGLTKRFLKGEARKNGFSSTFAYIQEHPITALEQLLPDYSYLSDGIALRSYPTGHPTNTFLETLNAGVSTLLSSDVNIHSLVSTSKDTITGIQVVNAPEKAPLWEHGYPNGFDTAGSRGLVFGEGDATVPTASATFVSASTTTLFATHGTLPEVASADIIQLLTGTGAGVIVDDWNVTKALLFQLFSPADIMVTDPNGRRVGMHDGGEVNEIPGAFYAGPEALVERLTIPNPIAGTYTISVHGTGEGSYEVLASYLAEGESDDLSRVGATTLGALTEHTIVLDEDGGDALQTEVTIERMLEDLSFAYAKGWVSKGVYTSISAKLKTASKMWSPIARKAVLRNIKKEIERAHGKGINDAAYEILSEDIDALLR